MIKYTMPKKSIFYIGIVLILISGGIFYLNFFPKKEIHYHAGFKVYLDGKLQDFTKSKFMFIKPCGDEEKEHEENEQLEKAHLHDKAGDVVHVEAAGAKWKDLFQNIGYKFNGTEPIVGFVNGRKIDQILEYPIKAYDSIIIFSGKTDNEEKKLKDQVSRDRIKQVEKSSESC